MVDTLPTVQDLKFTTLGRNSLLNRISDPVSLPTSANHGDHMDDLEDSYVDMDVDDAASETPESESGRTQPALLSRLGRRIDSPSPSSIPVIFRPDGTYTPPAIAGAFLPALIQSAESATSPQHAIQTTDVSNSGSSTSVAQPALEVMMDVVTQNNGDSYVEHTSHAIASGATVLESVASSSKSIMSPLHTPASRTVRQTNDVTMPCVEPLASPSQRTGSPRFVFKPLLELLQEERDAWGEVFEKKQARQAQVQSSTAEISESSRQASSSTVASAPENSNASAQTALRPISNDRRLPATSSVPTNSAIMAQRTEVPAQSNVDSVPSLPMFTSPILSDAIENTPPVIQAAEEEQMRSVPATISPTLDGGRAVDEGPRSFSTHHQAIPDLIMHPPEPGSFSGQVTVPRGPLHQSRDHLPTPPSSEESSASPASTERIGRMSSAPSNVFPNARLLRVPRVTPVSDMHPSKRRASPSPPPRDDIHQALKRRKTVIDAASHENAEIVRQSMPPAAEASDQLFRTLPTNATSGLDSLPHRPASTATSNFSTSTTCEKRRKTKSQLAITKTEETGDFSTILVSFPASAKTKKEEDEDSKARVKLEEDSKIGVKKEEEDEKPFAIPTSSDIPLKAPKSEEGDSSFNDKEGSPVLHSAEELAEPVSGGHSGNSRGETSSESPRSTPRQADIQPQDEHLQSDRNQQHQLGTPVHEETETRKFDHRHISHEVSNDSRVSQAAFPGEYHEKADAQEEAAGRPKAQSAPFAAAQNQVDAPDDMQASSASPEWLTKHLSIPVASRATSESTVSMSISAPVPRPAELDVRPAVTFDYVSQVDGHAAVRHHRSLSNEVQHRRPSPKRPVRSYDHWSPTPSPAPLLRPRYRPRSPSPERIGPRLLDSYRPAYGRKRTPPRFSRRGRGGTLESPTHNRSPIRSDSQPEVTRLGPRLSLRESADGEWLVIPRSDKARFDAPPHPRSRPPTNVQQPHAEPNHMPPSPSSRVAIVSATSDDDDQRMNHDKNAKNDSHERQFISESQLGADSKIITEGLPKQPLVAPVSTASTVTEREAPPRSTSNPSFPQNPLLHSNAGPKTVPNRKIVASNLAQADNGADRITDKPTKSLTVPLSPGTHQHEEDQPRKPTVTSTNFSANDVESLCSLRHDGHDGDLSGNNNAGAAHARETRPQENGLIENSRIWPRRERGDREIQHERAFAPEAGENPLLARISRQKLDSAASNDNKRFEAMSTDSDMYTDGSSKESLNPRSLNDLKDRISDTQATANATRRPDLDASDPALLVSRIGSALNISESDALPAERSAVVMPLSLRISGAPPWSQRPTHPLPPKPSVSHNADGSERSDKRVRLGRPQATNEPALFGRISSSGKESGLHRPPQNNSFATRSNNSGQEQIHRASPNVTPAKKRPLEKRLS